MGSIDRHHEARGWLATLFGSEDVAEGMEDVDVELAVECHYGGGWLGFVADWPTEDEVVRKYNESAALRNRLADLIDAGGYEYDAEYHEVCARVDAVKREADALAARFEALA